MEVVKTSSGGNKAGERAIGTVGTFWDCVDLWMMVWRIGGDIADFRGNGRGVVEMSGSGERRQGLARPVLSLAV